MWAYAREVSAKERLRECYNDIQKNKGLVKKSAKIAQALEERFSKEKMYERFVSNVVSLEEIEQMKQDIDDLLSDLL